MTKVGQADFMQDFMTRVANVADDHGKGFYYWEPHGFRLPVPVGQRKKDLHISKIKAHVEMSGRIRHSLIMMEMHFRRWK